MPRPISVKAVGKPIMITITMSASIKSPSAGSLMCSCPRPCRAGARSRRCAARDLLLDGVDLGDVVQAARPFAGPETEDATHDLGDALQHDQRSGERDHRLEVVDWRAIRRDIRMLPDPPRVGGVFG